ncbi:MAG: hypothetical protein WD229_19220 [Pirellulales bacterium]
MLRIVLLCMGVLLVGSATAAQDRFTAPPSAELRRATPRLLQPVLSEAAPDRGAESAGRLPSASRNSEPDHRPSLARVAGAVEMPSWFGWTANAFEDAAGSLHRTTTIMKNTANDVLHSKRIRRLGRQYGKGAERIANSGGRLGLGVYDLAGNAGSISGAAMGGDGVGFVQETGKAWFSGKAAAWGGLHGARIGANVGALFGPPGILVGGVVGGVGGSFAASFVNEHTISAGIDRLADKTEQGRRWLSDYSTASELLPRIRSLVERAEHALRDDRLGDAERLAALATDATARHRDLMESTFHAAEIVELQRRAFEVRGQVARARLAARNTEKAAPAGHPIGPRGQPEPASRGTASRAPPAPSDLTGRWGGGSFIIQSTTFDANSAKSAGCDESVLKAVKALEGAPMPLAIDLRLGPDGTGTMVLDITPPGSMNSKTTKGAVKQKPKPIPVRYENGKISGEITQNNTTTKIKGDIIATQSGWNFKGDWESAMTDKGRTVARFKGSLSGSK